MQKLHVRQTHSARTQKMGKMRSVVGVCLADPLATRNPTPPKNLPTQNLPRGGALASLPHAPFPGYVLCTICCDPFLSLTLMDENVPASGSGSILP